MVFWLRITALASTTLLVGWCVKLLICIITFG